LAEALPASQQQQQHDTGPPPLQGWESWGSVPPVPAATDDLATISSGEGTGGALASTLGDASTSADSAGSQRPAGMLTPRAPAASEATEAAGDITPSALAPAPAPGGAEGPPLGAKPEASTAAGAAAAAAAGRTSASGPAKQQQQQQQQPAPREAAGAVAVALEAAARQVSLESALEEELAGGLDPGFLPGGHGDLGAEGSSSPAATIILMEFCDRGSLEVALRQGRLLWRRDGTPDQVRLAWEGASHGLPFLGMEKGRLSVSSPGSFPLGVAAGA